MTFADRAEAGRSLAWRLGKYAKRQDVVVLAVPRANLRTLCPRLLTFSFFVSSKRNDQEAPKPTRNQA